MELNERYNQAFSIFAQWGPQRRIPVRTRWQEAFPQVTDAEMDEWTAEFRQIDEFAFSVAQQVRDRTLNQEEAIGQMNERYPRLDRELAKRSYTQAYFHAMA